MSFPVSGVSLKYFLTAVILLSSSCFVRLNRPGCFLALSLQSEGFPLIMMPLCSRQALILYVLTEMNRIVQSLQGMN